MENQSITVAGVTFVAVKNGAAYVQVKSDNPAVVALIGTDGIQYDPGVTLLVVMNTILVIVALLGL